MCVFLLVGCLWLRAKLLLSRLFIHCPQRDREIMMKKLVGQGEIACQLLPYAKQTYGKLI